jgi:N-sulfoglucosamine sulfohydrolase
MKYNRRNFLKQTSLLFTGGAFLQFVKASPRKASSKKNVLLLFPDDMSAHLECLGTKGISTPNTTNLAKEGVCFTNAFSSCSSCTPARGSVLTGMYPHSNGLWRNTVSPDILACEEDFSRSSRFREKEKVGVHDEIPTLIEILNERGYETVIANKFHLSPPWKFRSKHRIQAGGEIQSNYEKSKTFFESCGNNPFFMFACIGNTHRPFEKNVVKTGYPKVNPDNIEVPASLPDTPVVRKDLAQYYEAVQCVDATAGAILKALKESGKYNDTLILFAADQGYCYQRAKATTYDLGIRVPMIISGPGIRKKHISRKLTSIVDLMPTILEFLDIPVPEKVQGKALWPILRGDNNFSWRKYIFAEHNSHGPNPDEFYPTRSVHDERYHYIRNLRYNEKRFTGDFIKLAKKENFPHKLLYAGSLDSFQQKGWGNPVFKETVRKRFEHPLPYVLLQELFARPEEELYDLKKDPYELYNLAGAPDKDVIMNNFRKTLDLWMKQTNDNGIELVHTKSRRT